MAHRKVDTGTLLNTVKHNPCRGKNFLSSLFCWSSPPCYLHLICLHSSLLHNPQHFSRWDDSWENTCGNKLQILSSHNGMKRQSKTSYHILFKFTAWSNKKNHNGPISKNQPYTHTDFRTLNQTSVPPISNQKKSMEKIEAPSTHPSVWIWECQSWPLPWRCSWSCKRSTNSTSFPSEGEAFACSRGVDCSWSVHRRNDLG